MKRQSISISEELCSVEYLDATRSLHLTGALGLLFCASVDLGLDPQANAPVADQCLVVVNVRSSTHGGVDEGGWREKKSRGSEESCDVRARTAVGLMLLWPSRSSKSLAAISEQTGGLDSISQRRDPQPVVAADQHEHVAGQASLGAMRWTSSFPAS